MRPEVTAGPTNRGFNAAIDAIGAFSSFFSTSCRALRMDRTQKRVTDGSIAASRQWWKGCKVGGMIGESRDGLIRDFDPRGATPHSDRPPACNRRAIPPVHRTVHYTEGSRSYGPV